MEQEIEDGKFWLPTEFLNDEDLLMDFKSGTGIVTGDKGLFGPNSDVSSPVESVTETESDEEDYLNELSRKLAQSTLEDNFWKTETNFSLENHRSKSTRFMAQSTLCGCKQNSSPDCFSPESAWDVLYAAAGEVARLRMAEEVGFTHCNTNIAPQPPRPNFQFQQIQQQLIQQSRALNGGRNIKAVAPPLSGWPTLQPPPPAGSGMGAVFLANSNSKRESTGTGVFLPRQIGTPTLPPKKRGCSTVLLPDRVVHALNLNLNLEAQSRSNAGRDYDAQMRYRDSVLMDKDLRLPQEWTY